MTDHDHKPLSGDAAATDLAAAAEQMRQEAAALAAQAEGDAAEGARLMDEAQARASAILRDAAAAQRVLADSAKAAGQQASHLAGRAHWLNNAVVRQAQEDQEDQRARELEAEREQPGGSGC